MALWRRRYLNALRTWMELAKDRFEKTSLPDPGNGKGKKGVNEVVWVPEERGWEVTALCRGSCANRRTTAAQLLPSFPRPIPSLSLYHLKKIFSSWVPGLHSSRSFLRLPIFPTSSTVLAKCFINLYLNLLLKYNRYTEKGTEVHLDGFPGTAQPQMETQPDHTLKPLHSLSPNTSLEYPMT